ncbi:MAG TPA: hypothetical protein VJP85_08565 [Candidatus Baltobacteraceae bacterium]|nr:hypothetical protein [Candidatus Baltobacteraceae bacterium]
MNPAGEPVLLRPLSLGELFDRALTLYVRNIAPFTLIALVLVVPLAIAQYFAGLHESSSFAQMIAQIQHPGSVPAQAVSPAQNAWTVVMVALAVVLNAFSVAAIAVAVAGLYRGEPVDWRVAYAKALRRAQAIVATLFAEIGLFVAAFFVGAIALTLAFVVAFLLVRTSPPLGVIAFAAAIAVAVAWFIAIVLCYLVFGFALCALAIEERGAGYAIGSGFSRVFNRSELLRAVLVCLALVVIYAGFSVISLAVAGTLETMNLHIVDVIVSSLLSLVSTALLGVLLVVYYFDVRVRREGLDMQAQIESLHPAASAP